MRDNHYSELISKVLNVEYSKAIQIFETMSNDEQESVLWLIAEKNEMAIYPFVLCMLNNKKSVFLYNILYAILSCALCYIEGAYQMAVYHTKQQIVMYPNDITCKERMLELYYIPDVYAERIDYLKFAEDILSQDNNNAIAREFVTNKTKGEYGNGLSINPLFDEIKYLHFDSAFDIVKQYSYDKIYEEIFDLANCSKSMVVYLFLEYLLEKNESIFINTLAFDILTSPLSHIGGTQQMAAYHACKLLKLGAESEKYQRYIEKLRMSYSEST